MCCVSYLSALVLLCIFIVRLILRVRLFVIVAFINNIIDCVEKQTWEHT